MKFVLIFNDDLMMDMFGCLTLKLFCFIITGGGIFPNQD